MNTALLPLSETFESAKRHWRRRRSPEEILRLPHPRGRTAFTIAVSRECGSEGEAVARAVGSRLGWPVYDRELLDAIAEQTGLRTELLQSLDEKQSLWINEWLESLLGTRVISSTEFAKQLAKTISALATLGNCILIGRGAGVILPEAATLRVRLMAPLKTRIARIEEMLGVTPQVAAAHVADTDLQRAEFVRGQFRMDINDIHEYDIVLNTARFSTDHCADLIVAGLRQLESLHKP